MRQALTLVLMMLIGTFGLLSMHIRLLVCIVYLTAAKFQVFEDFITHLYLFVKS